MRGYKWRWVIAVVVPQNGLCVVAGTYDFTDQNVTLLKKYPKGNFLDFNGMFFWGQRPQNRGGPHENISKTLIYPFFSQKWPPRGGGGLPDFTRRGTNYLHTPLLKKYPKSKSLDSNGILFNFSAPKNGGGPHENIFKTLIYPFFPKMAPGGGIYQISPDVALTTCIHLYSKSTQRANLWTPTACFLD